MSRAELELEAQSLEPGESIRMVCPFCGGGNSREKSLSLTHREDGALLFHCYRANCSAAGALGGGTSLVRTRPEPKPRRTKDSIEWRLEYIADGPPLWNMNRDLLHVEGVDWDPYEKRYALPIWSPSHVLRGRVLRVPPDDTRKPKVLTIPYLDEPLLSWFGNLCKDAVYVVEDIPSAIRIALRGERAVALNGTHLTTEAEEELDRNATDVIWALDPDALSKAIKWCTRTRVYFRNSGILVIPRDFKDMTEEEVTRCLSEISWPRSSRAEGPLSA